VIELLVNRARSFIFTTGLAPPAAAAALAALEVVLSAEGADLARRLRRHIDAVRPGHPSPVVPVVLGTEHDALAAADRLLAQGLLVPAIRPPTVAPGTSRLRIALSAAHTDDQVALEIDRPALERTAGYPQPCHARTLSELRDAGKSAVRRREPA